MLNGLRGGVIVGFECNERSLVVEEAFRREEEQMDMENLSVGVTHGLERTYFVASSSVQAVFGIED